MIELTPSSRYVETGPMICNYCGQLAKQVTGRDLYPHRTDLYDLKFYQCAECDAYVGTHKKTGKPLGTLARVELRKARSKCHELFDRKWKSGDMSRTEAYAWLADKLGIPRKDCHISMFDERMCTEVQKLFGVRMQYCDPRIHTTYRRVGLDIPFHTGPEPPWE